MTTNASNEQPEQPKPRRRMLTDEKPSAEALATMRERGGTWAAYECHALDSSEVGQLRFLAFGEGRTFAEAPERMPDTQHGIGWRYVLVGYVNLATGDIEQEKPT